MIYLCPHSGLANRLRVVFSGISLAKELKQPVTLIWIKDPGCNIEFYELFKPINLLAVKKHNWKSYILKKIRGKKYLDWIPQLIGVDFFMFDEHFPKYVWNSNPHRFDTSFLKKKARDIYINSCNDFYYNSDVLELFEPVDKVSALVAENTKEFTFKTIGVHIRRKDNDRSLEKSPLELFIQRIQDDIDRDKEIDFFLATDDLETEQFLKEKFPGKIRTTTKVISRSSNDGMIGAMVDLYCLSKSSKIYGSYWSSFSDVAARIGKISCEVIQRN